jgi:group I intron endonuclease
MIVYMTINLVNNKKYIGIDSKNNPDYLGSGKILKKAIEKYGRENFQKILLEECNSKEELFEKEKEWIGFFNAVNDKEFYNILSGGQGVLGYIYTEDQKKRRSENNIGDKNPMFGKSAYGVWLEKYGEAEALNKMKELKEKRSVLQSGKNNPMYGKRNTGRCKYIGKFDINGNLLGKFKTVREASLKCHHKRCNIAKWRKSGLPNYLKHIWKFITAEEYLFQKLKNETS